MRIVLNGVETNNKGAELMLYAILQEIERKFPDAEVFMPYLALRQGLDYVKTGLKFRYKPSSWLIKCKVQGVLRRLRLAQKYYDTDTYPIKDVDYFIDASGFAISDQWHLSPVNVEHWRLLLSGMKKSGAKIVFLPQAFGPIGNETTKQALGIINQYADLIMPREKVSLKYLNDANVNPDKIRCYTDFTSVVAATVPAAYSHLADGVCIIPNMRMIDKGTITLEAYLAIIENIADLCMASGHKVYMLNHEGADDAELGRICVERIGKGIELVTGLNALEVKGLISTSYLCITSRFHGVASALNSCVPCLAPSRSHKYEELFRDYGMTDCVLDLTDMQSITARVSEFLSPDTNAMIRGRLAQRLPAIKQATREMWDAVWQ